MISTLLYATLAILAMGFLVFIHEMGHYLMAKKVGMRVEAFAIGFGMPIFQWKAKDGVEWRICILPFGGYVKIAGMQKEGTKEPHEIKDGFFGSSPLKRIQVAFMGPFVNVVFALFAFTLLWSLGGRKKSFTEFTQRIGWMDQKSELYMKGVRPGDKILNLNNKPFEGAKDLILSSVMNQPQTEIDGLKMDYLDQESSSFKYILTPYQDPASETKEFHTLGILSPASYLIYDEIDSQKQMPGSPIATSGIKRNDRIFWVDGQLVFSVRQLKSLLAEKSTFLTVKRGKEIFHSKIPRVLIEELSLKPFAKENLEDLRYESKLNRKKLEKLYTIPYTLSSNNQILGSIDFIDPEDQKKAFVACSRCPYFSSLEKGDEILAVDGKRVDQSDELFREMQEKRSLVIVQRDKSLLKEVSWKKADEDFDQGFKPENLETIVSSIGTDSPLFSAGNLHLLQPIFPLTLQEFPESKQKTFLMEKLGQKKQAILEIDSPEKRERYMKLLDREIEQPYLGALLKDRSVRFNPSPLRLAGSAIGEMGFTLRSLFSGSLSPKWLSGPVGIVHVVQHSWSLGVKEALYWMGLISLNLALLNLLPIPVLDGGHITLSLVEMVRKKPIKAKTMETLVIPFMILFIGFFLFVTYHDILRLIARFF